jgi:hypothetical protein
VRTPVHGSTMDPRQCGSRELAGELARQCYATPNLATATEKMKRRGRGTSSRVTRGRRAPEVAWWRWTEKAAGWSSVVARVEPEEMKLGRKMEPVEGGGPHGRFL